MSADVLGKAETGVSCVPLDSLRDEIARILTRAGASFQRENDYLRNKSHVSPETGRLPLGRPCRFDALLGGGLKLGTLTEILSAHPGDAAAASGFLLALANRLAARPAKAKAAIIWIFEDFAAREQ